MHRFFEDRENLKGNKIFLSKENSHHIDRVLRIRQDEDFELVVDGIVHLANIHSRDNNSLVAEIKDSYEDKNESNIKIRLFQGLPKSDKMELVIQKCVELGVYEIIPFESERTIVKWNEKKQKKKNARYNDIALAAAKQSKRGYVPRVGSLISLDDLLEMTRGQRVILAYEGYGSSLRDLLLEAGDDCLINIVVGPEGGFSEEEVEKFMDQGSSLVNLGRRILRTETAAIALTAMIQYELGDINEDF